MNLQWVYKSLFHVVQKWMSSVLTKVKNHPCVSFQSEEFRRVAIFVLHCITGTSQGIGIPNFTLNSTCYVLYACMETGFWLLAVTSFLQWKWRDKLKFCSHVFKCTSPEHGICKVLISKIWPHDLTCLQHGKFLLKTADFTTRSAFYK